MDRVTVEYDGNLDSLIKQLQEYVKIAKAADDSTKKLASTTEEAAKARERSMSRENQKLKDLKEQREKAYDPKTIQEYDKAIQETKKNIESLTDKEEELTSQTDSLKDEFTSLSGVMAGVFSVAAIVAFIKQVVTLNLETQGVRGEFAKLDDPNTLSKLSTAVKGTVTDLELMQQAVRAADEDVDLSRLRNAFKLARIEAARTDQEVTDLTETVVDGFANESAEAFEALGIDIDDFNKELIKTGDFAQAASNLINDALEDAGDGVENNQQILDKLANQWQNFILLLTSEAQPAIDIIVKALERINNALLGEEVRQQQQAAQALSDYIDKAEKLTDLELDQEYVNQATALQALTESNNKQNAATIQMQQELEELEKKHSVFGIVLGEADKASLQRLKDLREWNEENQNVADTYQDQVDVLQNQIKELERIQKERDAESSTIERNVHWYRQQIGAVNQLINSQNTQREEIPSLVLRLQELQNELEKLLEVSKIKIDISEGDLEDAITPAELVDSDPLADIFGEDLAGEYKTIFDEAWEAILKDTEENQQKITEIEQAELDKRNAAFFESIAARKQAQVELAQNIENLALGSFDTIQTISSNASQAEIQRTEERLKRGEISEEKSAQIIRGIRQREARQSKDLATFEAITNTALAVTKVLAQTGDFTGITAAIIAAQGALQVAAIRSQPIPTFHTGSEVGIATTPGMDSNGEFFAKLIKGETVMSKMETDSSAGILTAIKAGKLNDEKLVKISTTGNNMWDSAGLNGLKGEFKKSRKNEDNNFLSLAGSMARSADIAFMRGRNR